MNELPMSETQNVPEQPQRRGRMPAVLLVGALVLAIGGGVVWWMTRKEPVAVQAPVAVTPPVSGAAQAPTAPIEGSDVDLRAWAEKLTSHPEWARWLEGGDFARRFVATLQRISEGESPRPMLGFLGPSKPFEVVERGSVTLISQASYERYDSVADVIGSIDVAQAAQAWRSLEPVFESAHREIAPPGATVRRTLDAAIEKLLAVPVPAAAVEVEPKGALYVFTDPELEALSPAQKHLLRFGPRNERIVQGKLRELQSALRQ